MPLERVSDVGEFALLARLRRRMAGADLGDDAAILPLTPGTYLLATVDAQVDGVHFLRERMTPQQVGRRAMAVNLSDIAAMGGRPTHALVSLLLPPALEAAYDGLRDEAGRWQVAIAGGNISSTPGPLVLDVTVLGAVPDGEVLRRGGARAGAAAVRLELDPVALALYGGEDYELLITCHPDDVPALAAAIEDTGTALTVIGEVRPSDEGVSVRFPDGVVQPLAGGWDHFVRTG